MTSTPAIVSPEAWLASGARFRWSPAGGDAAPVDVFHVETGDADAPVMVLVHGFPTSSLDWSEVVAGLSGRYRVCLLDFPGYGFSDKPRGWGYSLQRDAELLDHYLAEIVGTTSAVMVAHDRGDSVALVHAANLVAGRARVGLDHLVMSNANIFLPLSNLTGAQRRMLHDPEFLDQLTPELLAAGVGAATFTPPRRPDDAEVRRMAVTFAHGDGVAVLHETIQYLIERSVHEAEWLDVLAGTDIPTTLFWGVYDTVSPLRVADHVWHEYLRFKPGSNTFYLVPGANHYVQVDRPDAVVEVIRHTLEGAAGVEPGALDASTDAPLLVDRSRTALADATEVVNQRAPSRSIG